MCTVDWATLRKMKEYMLPEAYLILEQEERDRVQKEADDAWSEEIVSND